MYNMYNFIIKRRNHGYDNVFVGVSVFCLFSIGINLCVGLDNMASM